MMPSEKGALAALLGPSLRPLAGSTRTTYQPPAEGRREPVRATSLPRPPAPAPIAPVRPPVAPVAPPAARFPVVDSERVGMLGVVAYLRQIDAPQSRRCAAPSCPRNARMHRARCEVCGGA